MKKYKDIPQELKDLAQWVVWGKVAKNAPKKQPYNAKTDMPAKVDASSTWATFEDCMQAIKNANTLVLVLSSIMVILQLTLTM